MAAGSTYTRLAGGTLTGTQSTYTFSSISGSYTDLVLVIAGTLDNNSSISMQLNGDTGSNYSLTYMQGNGSSATSGHDSTQNYMALGYLNSTAQGICIFNIQSYSSGSVNKSVLCQSGVADDLTRNMIGLWRSNSAVTSILVSPLSGVFSIGTSFQLYGIAAA